MNSSFTQLIHHKHPAHGSVEGCCSGGGQLPKWETASHGRAGSDSVLVSTVREVPRAPWALREFTVHMDLEGKKGVFWDAGRRWVLLCSGAARSGDGEEEAVPAIPCALLLIFTPDLSFFSSALCLIFFIFLS